MPSKGEINLEIISKLKKELHPSKNDNIKLENLNWNDQTDINWICDKGHEWKTQFRSRYSDPPTSCPICKRRLSRRPDTSFLNSEFHPTKNEKSHLDEYNISDSKTKIWWTCEKNHEYQSTFLGRFSVTRKYTNARSKLTEKQKKPCPICKVEDSELLKELSKTFHPTKNDKEFYEITLGRNDTYWWICDHGHEWNQAPRSRINYLKGYIRRCPYCSGRKSTEEKLFKNVYPKLYSMIDKHKNKDIKVDELAFASPIKVDFICDKNEDHKFSNSLYKINLIVERAKKNKVTLNICPICKNYKTGESNLLINTYPNIAKQYDQFKNKKPLSEVRMSSDAKVWWKCEENEDHIWLERINVRVKNNTKCPVCSQIDDVYGAKWTKKTIISFVSSLSDKLDILSPAEIWLIFEQTGLPRERTKIHKFIEDLSNKKFSKKEMNDFVDEKETKLDDYFDSNITIEQLEDIRNESKENISSSNIDTNIISEGNENLFDKNNFHSFKAEETLKTLEYCIRNSDQEAVDFLLTSAKNKLWKNVFKYEVKNKKNKYVEEIFSLKPKDEYSKKVHKEFVKEYSDAKSLTIPKGFSFKIDGKPELPNLMQLRTASRIKKDRYVGNWSGTGAGKTLSAILASRVINSKLTLICCPNSVVNNWETEIMEIYPDSFVQKKSFDTDNLQKTKQHKYLVLNYEAFQQNSSDDDVLQLLENTEIDFVVIDEVHFTKQRNADLMSKRKRIIGSIITELRKKPNFSVLGMSATPVINNLEEGKGLIEMITGESHDDLDIKINVENCMKLHQKLVNNGLRMVFRPDTHLNVQAIDVDCSDYIEEFKALQNQWFPLSVEQITTKVKMKTILEHIRPKTLIYTHYRQGIDQYLFEQIEKAGWRVGFFTGEDKSGLDEFKKGTLDVLIGTSTIGTGVNGLQNICSNLIINSMPWTNAEFEQLIGRIYRQNQKQKKVDVIIPLTKAVVNGEDWSWCQSRYNRIKFKKTVGDAVIDGVLPTESIRTQAQVVQDIKKWLDRLSKGDETIIKRAKLKSQFIPGDKDNIKKRVGKFGDFSKMNTRWNKTHSDKLHERLKKDSTEFYHYHEMMEEKVKDWSVVPAKQIIKYYKNRPSRVIGDFGCGKAHLYNELSNKHQIYSFDHVAVNDNVTACDFSHTPLDPETLDSAVFSLSFMGSNITDYVKEAFRVMKVDGRIHIIEATSRFKNLDNFVNTLEKIGFEMVQAKPMSDRFTHIMAIKSDQSYNEGIKLVF